MIASRLVRVTLVFLLFMTSLGLSPAATRAQENAPFPPNPLPGSATLNYVVDGEIDAEFAGSGRLVFERFELETGDTMPAETGPQILVNIAGVLETVDDLGLTASLKAGDRLFAPAGTIDELTAKEKSTILRARFARPGATDADPVRATVTIYEARCDPNTASVPSGSTIEVINATNQTQPFTIESLDIAVEIEPDSSAKIVLTDTEVGTRVAKCGKRKGSESPIGSPAFQITEPDPVPTQAATQPELDGQTILLDAPLDTSEILTTLYVAKVTLQGKSNTGEQSFDGITGIVAISQPLSLVRSGRLPATLPVGSSVALPAGTEITIENTATGPTEFFVVGLAAADSPESSNTSSTDSGADDDRPTSRDTADAAPTDTVPVEPGSDEGNTADEMSDLVPDRREVEALGFEYVGEESQVAYDDTLLTTFDPSSRSAGWNEGMFIGYESLDGTVYLVFRIDHFDSASDAGAMIDLIHSETTDWGTAIRAPQAENADSVIAIETNVPASDFTGYQITGQFGEFLVTVLWLGPLFGDGMPDTIAAWELVDTLMG